MGLCNLFSGNGSGLTTAVVIVLLFCCCGFGNGILDCLCNLDTCAIICLILFALHCCGFFEGDSNCPCVPDNRNACSCGC